MTWNYKMANLVKQRNIQKQSKKEKKKENMKNVKAEKVKHLLEQQQQKNLWQFFTN